MTIRYSPVAWEDLRELRGYLTGEFGAGVAVKSVQKILKDISSLKRLPNPMRPLADKIDRPTDYRYFVCGKYSVAILLEDSKTISVIRILDARTDYATAVFGPVADGACNQVRRRRR